MANDTVSGTFAAIGQSATIGGKKIDIAMDFAGTASVNIERLMPGGSWMVIGSAVTADYNEVAEYPAPVSLRLNCTAYTNDVVYVMRTGTEG
jgi:hypothetical protein